MPGDEFGDRLRVYGPGGESKRVDHTVALESVRDAGGLYEAGLVSGDYVPVDSYTFPQRYTTTSATFTDVVPFTEKWYPLSGGYPDGAELVVRFCARLSADSGGETVSARLRVSEDGLCDNDITLSVTGVTPQAVTGREAVIDQTSDFPPELQMKVTSGTGLLDHPPRVLVEVRLP